MDILPSEIIEVILNSPNLSFRDVVTFSSTCSKFRDCVNLNSKIWKTKYYQCWTNADADLTPVENWYCECIARKTFEKNVMYILSWMQKKFYNISNINTSDLDNLTEVENLKSVNNLSQLLNSHKYGYLYMKEYILSINSLPTTKALTHKYYGNILLKFINKKYYGQIWTSLLNLENKLQTLEKGAIFVNNWFEETKVDVSKSVNGLLNQTADLVKRHLLQQQTDHPLKDISEEIFHSWERENILDNMFSPNDCKTIITSINYILFEHFNYFIHYDVDRIERMKCCIEHAMKEKLATSLIFAVIYESIARRVGVKVEVFQFSNHSLLSWRESYRIENSPSLYISISKRGKFMKSGQCPFSAQVPMSDLVSSSSKMAQIAHTAACNMWVKEVKENNFPLMNALDLVLIVSPPSFHIYKELGWSYMQHGMDVDLLVSKVLEIKTEVVEDKQRFQHLLASLVIYQTRRLYERNCPRDITPKTRTNDIEFAVGMVIRNKRSGCFGIICGWGTFAVENAESQLLYTVLCDTGETAQVPPKDLQILHSPLFISHPCMGRYFEEYVFSYYKPNSELQAEYPEDLDALQLILKADKEPERME